MRYLKLFLNIPLKLEYFHLKKSIQLQLHHLTFVESPDDDPAGQMEIVEVAIPEIIITEILSNNTPLDTPVADHDNHEFYAKQLDEMFTFDEAGVDVDAHSTSSSSEEESVVQVHASEVLDEDTGEVTPPPRSGNSPNVHFDVDVVASSSDEDLIDDDDDEQAVVVAPSSPLPPPLPPASLLISPHLSARSRAVVVEAPADDLIPEQEERKEVGHLNDFQLELRNTLKLRHQKMIDSIENTVVNVNEGIEIFGGKRSRTTSSAEDFAAVVVHQPTVKPGNKLENHAFVEKLDSILKSQIIEADKKPRAKVYKQKRVVVVEDVVVATAPKAKAPLPPQPQMRFSTSELMSAKMKLRSSAGESIAGDVNLSFVESSTPVAEPVQPKPAPRVNKTPKSLEALGSDVNVMIIGAD